VALPLTQHELDAQRCAVPGCSHDSCELVLAARCHLGMATIVTYVKARGVLVVTCAVCQRVVTEISVAP
jgi:hypothetical protein